MGLKEINANILKVINSPPRKAGLSYFIMIILWLAIILPILLTKYLKKDNGNYGIYTDAGYTLSPELETDKKPFEGVLLYFNYISIKPNEGKLELRIQGEMQGEKYTDEFGASKVNATCNFYYGEFKFDAGKTTAPVKIILPIDGGNARYYPFDSYTTFFTLSCLKRDKEKTVLPLAFVSDYSLHGYNPELSIEKIKEIDPSSSIGAVFYGLYDDSEAFGLLLKIDHEVSTKLFSIFIAFVMWALAIPILIASFDIIVFRREQNPAFVAMGITVMFALPALRNTQPSSPGLGCLSDIYGFFWVLAIVALCAMVNLFAFALRWRKPKTLSK